MGPQLKLTYPVAIDYYHKAEVDSKDQALLVNFYTQLVTTSGDLVAQITTDYITHIELTTISGDIVAQFPSLAGYATELWVNNGFISNEGMTTISGDLVSQIAAGDVSQAELLTTSGDIVLQIPSLVGYATEAWVNIHITTTSGDIVAQIPIDYITLQKLTTTSGDVVAQIPLDYITSLELLTTSGDLIAQVPSLSGYATETWVTNRGYSTVVQLTTTSGDIIAQIPSLVGYATESWTSTNYIDNSEIVTISGDIVARIPSLSGYATETWVGTNFIDTLEMTSTSGDIVVQIPSLAGYATEPWVNLGFVSNEKMTTTSGDIVDQIPTDYVTGAEILTTSGDIIVQIPSLSGYATESWAQQKITTTSGDIVSQIPVDYISDSEMTTISGDLVAQMGAGGVTLEQLTTASGDIVAQIVESGGVTLEQLTLTSGDIIVQIPSLSGYSTESWVGTNYIDNFEMTTISGDLVSQLVAGGLSQEDLLTASGDIVVQIPSLAGYATESWANGQFIDNSEMTTISGDIISQMSAGGVTLGQLTTTSGDILSTVNSQDNSALVKISDSARDVVGGRLDISSITSSGTGTSLVWTAVTSSGIGLYNGSYWQVVTPANSVTFTYLSTVYNATATSGGYNYDIFAEFVSSSEVVLKAQAWTSDTVRSKEPSIFEGVYVYDLTEAGKQRRYLGTARRRSTYDREWVDTDTQRFVVNHYNAVPKTVRTANSLAEGVTYKVDVALCPSLREFRGGTGQTRGEFLRINLSFSGVVIASTIIFSASTGSNGGQLCLGTNSTSSWTQVIRIHTSVAGRYTIPAVVPTSSCYVGYNYITINESMEAATTITVYAPLLTFMVQGLLF
jgi:DUF4097 and DUF4098 domain-containing protein YvlB